MTCELGSDHDNFLERKLEEGEDVANCKEGIKSEDVEASEGNRSMIVEEE